MERKASAYVNLGYWCILYLPLILLAFYVTYFTVFFTPKSNIIHFHFGVMILWLGLLIMQPLLIKHRAYTFHRLLGRSSYVIIPLVLLSSCLMLRMGYHNYIHNLAGRENMTKAEVLHEGAVFASLASLYIVWLPMFFALAIYFRKNMTFHSRFMAAAALTFIGPIVDRIFFTLMNVTHIGFMPAECISFLIIDGALIALLVQDIRMRHSTAPLIISLCLYVVMQASYFFLQTSSAWDYTVTLIFQPDL